MSKKLLVWLVAPVGLVLVVALAVVYLVGSGVGGELQGRGQVSRSAVPEAEVRARREAQRASIPPSAAGAGRAASAGSSTSAGSAASAGSSTSAEAELDRDQILFGDLHVHTTWSGDAFVFSLPIFQGEGAHPPADACDFARHCAQLDFWSINDHAESITPRQWAETREAVRECNAVAADPANPDLVTFLGWEWTQSAPSGAEGDRVHYGHKNVVLLDQEEGLVPTRPIGAGRGGLFAAAVPSAVWPLVRFGLTAFDWPDIGPYLDFNSFANEVSGLAVCESGVPVRELPETCIEGAETPELLFEKLDDWGFASLVIPHGTSWGVHAPPEAHLARQLSRADHDPERQRLFEVYSGHGSSEQLVSMPDTTLDDEGETVCAEPTGGYEPCCWRAGEIVRERCAAAGTDLATCDARAADARAAALAASAPMAAIAGTTPNDWRECGQAAGRFLPAYDYRSNMSAQVGLALRSEDGSTYRYGLIGSSDNHKARPGPGYKEVARKAFGDAYGFSDAWYDALAPGDAPEAIALAEPRPLAGALVAFERGASFYYTGGLVAVHSAGRDRASIFDALHARNTYATSGPRILLWFDLLNGPGGEAPMGSVVDLAAEAPRFRVRAAGALEQKPGCPDSAATTLGRDRLELLCRGECHHPGDARHAITRIEVVRILKQRTPDEPVAGLIMDPWRSFDCPAAGSGCTLEFEGEAPESGREAVYYVRALQAPTPAVNGDPMRCERDASGRCTRARACPASGPDFDPRDDCLSPVEERAWSSPIFVRS